MRIKICGITRLEDARLAMELGAWSLGFIFWAKSPRSIAAAAAKDILVSLAQLGLKPQHAVGVFVNASASEIRQVATASGIDTVQLHGDESPDLCAELQDLHVWKAFRLRSAEQLLALPDFEPSVQAFLFDAAVAGQYGGTGHTTDWKLVTSIRSPQSIILSGGLNPENLATAEAEVGAFAYDLSSGVESAPGVKDHEKLKKLFAQRGRAYVAES